MKATELRMERLLEALGRLEKETSIHVIRDEVSRILMQLQPNGGMSLPSSRTGSRRKGKVVSRPGELDDVPLRDDILAGDLRQIVESRSTERAVYYIGRLRKSITKVKTRAFSDINLNRWKEYDDILTDSLWLFTRRDSSGAHSAGYWGNFIPQIPSQLLRRYTKKGEWVLDTFAGCGTTLIESQRLGRNGIGIELQEAIAEKARESIAREPDLHGVTSAIVTGDSAAVNYRKLLGKLGIESVQFIIMHPPYLDIIQFSDSPADLSNAATVDDFVDSMGVIVRRASECLDKGRFFALVIGDKFSKGEWIPLGFLLMQRILTLDFILKSVVVKNFEDTTGKRNQKELWRFRALSGGFYVFKHEYIFIFQKR